MKPLQLMRAIVAPAAFALLLALPALARPAVSVFAQTSPGCGVDASHLAPDAEEMTVLNEVNAYRAANGLQPVRLSWSLTVSALWKSSDMAANHYFDHDDLSRSWLQRLSDCGYDTSSAFVGENLAAGNPSGDGTVQQWKASPPHNANLLDPQFTAVGIKRVQSNDEYGWYWTMEFGSTLDYDLLSGS